MIIRGFEVPERCQWITERDRRQFEEDGYMVVRGVVPAHFVEQAVGDIAAFVRADLRDSTTWYNGPPDIDGVVPLHHAQSLWDIRQLPSLYQVFAGFFGTPRLMLDINRCLFRPPVDPGRPGVSGPTMHWDADPRSPLESSLQAVILLSNVRRNGGGFHCIPEIFRDLDAWLDRNARAEFDFIEPGLSHANTTQVEGAAGDVILWSTKLPHGSAINLSNQPRMAMFVTMQPPEDEVEAGESLQRWWRTKRAPDHWRGMPGQLDPEPGPPAVLSQLGLKLIGATPW